MKSVREPRRKLFDCNNNENIGRRKKKWAIVQRKFVADLSQLSTSAYRIPTESQPPPPNPLPSFRPALTERQQMTILLQMTTAQPISDTLKTPLPSKRAGRSHLLADVRVARRLHKRNERGETPVHVATIRGDAKQVSRLIRLGADVNCTDFAGWSPLHEACNHGWLKVVQQLIKAGANVNARGPDDVSPLHDAAINGHHEIVELLLQKRANRDSITAHGKTPLALASSHPRIVHLLQPPTTADLEPRVLSDLTTVSAESTVPTGSCHNDEGEHRPEQASLDKQLTAKSSFSSKPDPEPKLCLNNMRKSSPQHQTPRGPDKPSSPRLTLRFQPIKSRDDRHGGGGGTSSKTSSEVSSSEPRYQSYCVTMETGDTDATYNKLKRGGSGSSGGGADNHHHHPGTTAPLPPPPATSAADGDHCYEHQQQNVVTSSGGRFAAVSATSANAQQQQQQPQHYHAPHTSDATEFNHRPAAASRGSDNHVAPSLASASNSHNERHHHRLSTEQQQRGGSGASFTDGHHADDSPEGSRNGDGGFASGGGNQNNHVRPDNNEAADSEDSELDDGRRKRRKEYGRDASSGEPSAKLPATASSAASNNGAMALRNHVGRDVKTAGGSGSSGSNGEGERKSTHKAVGSVHNNSGSDTESTPSDAELECAGAAEVAATTETVALTGGSGLPKVPPLKIVIPPSSASEQDRDRSRLANRQALPYIVSVSGDAASDGSSGVTPPSSGSVDKEGVMKEDGKSRDGLGCSGGATTEEQRSQRVTRSSQRAAALGGPSTPSTSSGTGATTNPGHPIATTSNASPVVVLNSSGVLSSYGPLPECGTSGGVGGGAGPSSGGGAPATTSADGVGTSAASGSSTKPKYGEAGEGSAEEQCGPDVPPRKRKMRTRDGAEGNSAGSSASSSWSSSSSHCEEQSILNCYEMYLNIRRQIDRRRKGMFVVQPKPPQGFKDYLMNRCSYVLAGNSASRLSVPMISPPQSLTGAMKELFVSQEKERYNLRLQHLIEKEKLVLMVEQEILRVHGRAARATANQTVPLSVCTILRDEEIYNQIEPEQEEKERNARTRFTGRHLLSWLQDVDDKWEKVKEAMLLRHHNEAESLHAAQKLDWEWKMKELSMCDIKSTPVIDVIHVPMVHVSDEFDLLTA